jgi:hypothetical protein
MVDLNLVKSEHLWYVIGLMVTDGNLSKDGRHLNITSLDGEHLQEVKKVLYLKNKLTMKASGKTQEKKYYFLQFGDVKFYKFLSTIGLTAKKSLTIGEIKVPAKYFSDFVRGVIDGDGSIRTWIHPTNHNIQWSLRIFSGSLTFVTWLNSAIATLWGVKGKIHAETKQKGHIVYTLKYGKLAAQVICKSTYYTGCFALPRKLVLAQQCIEAQNKFVKYGSVIKL